MSFERPKKDSRLSIGSLDEPSVTVTAQYNPATIEIAQNVPWKKPDAATQNAAQGGATGQAAKSKKDENYMALEFTGAEGRSVSVELLFDGMETRHDASGEDWVAKQVGVLEQLARVRDPSSDEDKLRRPHHCVVEWGGALPKFQCVIASLTTKYTMFSATGTPLRATCTIKLTEAARVDKKKKGA